MRAQVVSQPDRFWLGWYRAVAVQCRTRASPAWKGVRSLSSPTQARVISGRCEVMDPGLSLDSFSEVQQRQGPPRPRLTTGTELASLEAGNTSRLAGLIDQGRNAR